jgi:thioredoxin 1
MKALVFTSRYCPYCRAFEKIVERLKEELNGTVEFEIVDVDEKRELAENYDVLMLPTLVLTDGGEVVGGFMGFADYRTARDAILEQISASPEPDYKN